MDGLGYRESPFLKCTYSILDARSALLLLVAVVENTRRGFRLVTVNTTGTSW